uniref:NADH-ubiquinone oxidoreductase chain 3 n=1 Tax=Leptopilina boulardi TaxID=63433 RepID=A0A1L3MYB0_9HYME|nr:NADH dehydrogenase subunit 3 [Leptopilina boulardi]
MNLILIFLGMLILCINMILSKKSFKLRGKVSTFECGFDSLSLIRVPFSIQFYLISIIFLVFDVEITLILPVVKLFKLKELSFKFIFYFILAILLGGVYYELKEGSLSWV